MAHAGAGREPLGHAGLAADQPGLALKVSPWSDEAEQLKDLDACNFPYALETFQKFPDIEKLGRELFGRLENAGPPWSP